MTQQGEEKASQIHDGLLCPSCEYSLRGLPGDLVVCPECGSAINIPALVTSKWTGAWYTAPLYNMLALPLAWALITSMAAFYFYAAIQHGQFTAPFALITPAIILGGWILLVAGVSRRYGGVEGTLLALLLHICFPAYVLGFIFGIGFGIKSVVDLSNGQPYLLLFDLPMVLVCIAAIVIGRLIERFVAHRCIRRYLLRRTGRPPA